MVDPEDRAAVEVEATRVAADEYPQTVVPPRKANALSYLLLCSWRV